MPLPSLPEYLRDRHKQLADDYRADCKVIAREIAGLLIERGRNPFIVRLHKKEMRAAGRFHYPIIPKRYSGRITWTKHYVCCCDGMVYDPILDSPVAIDRYSRIAFGEDYA